MFRMRKRNPQPIFIDIFKANIYQFEHSTRTVSLYLLPFEYGALTSYNPCDPKFSFVSL